MSSAAKALLLVQRPRSYTGGPARSCPPSDVLHPLGLWEHGAVSSDVARARDRRGVRGHQAYRALGQYNAAGERGSEVSPGGVGQDQFVQRQIRYRSPKALVLLLNLFQPLQLVGLHAAVLLAPAVKGSFIHFVFSLAIFAQTSSVVARPES